MPSSRISARLRELTYSVPWNLGLLLVGTFIFSFGVKSVAVPFGFLPGGVTGLGLLVYYVTGLLSPGQWFFVMNVPIFVLGWRFVSRRFVYYSLFGMVSASVWMELITYVMPLEDKILAVLAGGSLMGAGTGIALRSMGSTGGLDIVGVILNQRWNIRIGQFFFIFNLAVFGAGLAYLDLNKVIYSLALVFVISWVTDYFLGMFNQRKMVLVVTDHPEEVANAILTDVNRGVTFLHGEGGFTGAPKKVILTVVNNIQLKRLEEAVYRIDSKAFTITGNTLNVLGEGFSTRRTY